MERIMKKVFIALQVFAVVLLVCCSGCSSIWGKVPIKQYYVLNYVASPPADGNKVKASYPFTLRLKELDIEEAYARPQIVYRQNPFELLYYINKFWAVKPNRMVTDLIRKQIISSNMVKQVVRRYDEGIEPDFELTGLIEAIEEYDSDHLWFAHLALRLTLTRNSDGQVLYTRQFDNRKRVFRYSPDAVVQELSSVLEFIMDQAIGDMSNIFAREAGLAPATGAVDTTRQLGKKQDSGSDSSE
jgi:ABC-type uncharacterized transport system auxiliary subunit